MKKKLTTPPYRFFFIILLSLSYQEVFVIVEQYNEDKGWILSFGEEQESSVHSFWHVYLVDLFNVAFGGKIQWQSRQWDSTQRSSFVAQRPKYPIKRDRQFKKRNDVTEITSGYSTNVSKERWTYVFWYFF